MLWWDDSAHLECQGEYNYHLFLNTKEVFKGKAPQQECLYIWTLGWERRPAFSVVLSETEGVTHKPALQADRALTACGCLWLCCVTACGCLSPPPQLSGLLQVCPRTGTETQAKFTSMELLREYISVRNQCKRRSQLTLAEFRYLIFLHVKGISLKIEIGPQPLFLTPIFTI